MPAPSRHSSVAPALTQTAFDFADHGPEPLSSAPGSNKSRARNLEGLTFGMLTVLHRSPNVKTKAGDALWICRCECGKSREAVAYHLVGGMVKDCGCVARGEKAVAIRLSKAQATVLARTRICFDCSGTFHASGLNRRYCPDCSEIRARKRRREWARRNPLPAEESREKSANIRSRSIDRGMAISAGERWSIHDLFPDEGGFCWVRRLVTPYVQDLSKNHDRNVRWAKSTGRFAGYALKRSTRAARQALSIELAAILADVSVVQNKLWIDLLVEKPDHKADAINFIDNIADSIKHAIPLDDRWYSFRRIDWRIIKDSPRFLIGLAQESDRDMQVCSYCGRILELSAFHASRNTKLGVSRGCKECQNIGGRGR